MCTFFSHPLTAFYRTSTLCDGASCGVIIDLCSNDARSQTCCFVPEGSGSGCGIVDTSLCVYCVVLRIVCACKPDVSFKVCVSLYVRVHVTGEYGAVTGFDRVKSFNLVTV